MFNQSLKRIRISAGRTQDELAKYLNISNQSVSKWEMGQSLPSVDMLPKIAEFYDCTINAFFSEYELEIFERINKDMSDGEDVTHLLLSLEPQMEMQSSENTIPTEALFLPKVYELITESDFIASSVLQRKLKLGYGLASRIVEALVSLGIAVFDPERKVYMIRKEKIHLLEPYLR